MLDLASVSPEEFGLAVLKTNQNSMLIFVLFVIDNKQGHITLERHAVTDESNIASAIVDVLINMSSFSRVEQYTVGIMERIDFYYDSLPLEHYQSVVGICDV